MTQYLCSECKYRALSASEKPCLGCFEKGPDVRGSWEPVESSPPAGPGSAVEKIPDPTNPAHYREFPVEVIQIVRHLNFNRGNAVKYVCRAGRKNLTEGQEVEDLKKAIWYLEDEIQRLTGEGTHAKP